MTEPAAPASSRIRAAKDTAPPRPAGRRQQHAARQSWRQAVARVGRFLGDLPLRWDGRRILVIGHVATRWGLDHLIGGVPLEDLIEQDFAWQEGWEYRIS